MSSKKLEKQKNKPSSDKTPPKDKVLVELKAKMKANPLKQGWSDVKTT